MQNQYEKQMIVDQIQATKKMIRLFLKANKTTEPYKFILAEERLNEAIRWLSRRK
jgi:hypothetical protein